MLASSIFAAAAVVLLLLAAYENLAETRRFGAVPNLVAVSVVLLLLATFLLVWELVLRLVARSEE